MNDAPFLAMSKCDFRSKCVAFECHEHGFAREVIVRVYRSTDIVRTICTNLEKIFLADRTDRQTPKSRFMSVSISSMRKASAPDQHFCRREKARLQKPSVAAAGAPGAGDTATGLVTVQQRQRPPLVVLRFSIRLPVGFLQRLDCSESSTSIAPFGTS